MRRPAARPKIMWGGVAKHRSDCRLPGSSLGVFVPMQGVGSGISGTCTVEEPEPKSAMVKQSLGSS